MAEPTILSKNNIPIRLPDERWDHIVQEHSELVFFRQEVLNTLANPFKILAGQAAELFAIREIEKGKWLVVIYSEGRNDGFVITAFLTRRNRWWEKRKQIWP